MQNLAKLLEEPTIASQLPIAFDNGVIVSSFSGVCPVCKRVFSPEEMRGRIDTYWQGVAVISAAAHCEREGCDCVVDLSLRVKNDRSTSTRVNGEWVVTPPPPPAPKSFRPQRALTADGLRGKFIGIFVGFCLAYFLLYLLSQHPDSAPAHLFGYNGNIYTAESIGKKGMCKISPVDPAAPVLVVPKKLLKRAA